MTVLSIVPWTYRFICMIALYDAMVADMVEEQNARSQFATLQAIIYL
jgi:hypothetical protein